MYGNTDDRRDYCWDCDAYTDSRPGTAAATIVKPSYQAPDLHKRKRISALPMSHPDAFPQNQKDAHRIMEKHSICPETGHWLDDKKKEAAVAESRKRPKITGKPDS